MLKISYKYDFYHTVNDEFRTMKKLYDYTLDYNFLEYYIKEYENKYNQQYYDYIIKYHTAYNGVNAGCMS